MKLWIETIGAIIGAFLLIYFFSGCAGATPTPAMVAAVGSAVGASTQGMHLYVNIAGTVTTNTCSCKPCPMAVK